MYSLFQRPEVRFWFLALLLSTTLLLGLRQHYHARSTKLEARAWQEQGERLDTARDRLEAELQTHASDGAALAEALRAALSAGRAAGRDEAQVMDEALTRAAPAGHAEFGAFLMPGPNSRYARCYTRDDEGTVHLSWDFSDRYLDPQYPAWLLPITDGAGWRTFVDPFTESWVAQYSAPFYLPDAEGVERAAGLAFVRLDYGTLRELVRGVDLGNTGYSYLMTESGELIDHPLLAEGQVGVTLFDLAERANDEKLAETAEKAILGAAPWIDRLDPATGTRARVFFRPLPSATWTLVGVSLRREVLGSEVALRRENLHISYCVLLVLFSAIGLIGVALFERREPQLWIASIAGSALMVVAIVLLWRSAVVNVEPAPEQVRILDEGGLRTYLGHWEASRPGGGEVVTIPTGVFVQSLEFSSANNVHMTGLVWQRFSRDLPEDFNRGFLMPEAVDLSTEELFRRPYPETGEPEGEVVGTWFNATLRQNFQFLRYPFDTKDVWIRLWPSAFDRDVVLVPDLESYTLTNPAVFPGLDSDFVLAGWKPVGSYFQYRRQEYNTDFGLDGFASLNVPELYFTVDVRRNFVDSFVSDLIPLLVVACLLFGVQPTLTTRDDRLGPTGFNFSTVLGASLALVFVVVVAHIQLRTMLAGQPIVYLEWFYFSMYVLVVAISLNGWLVAQPSPPRFVAYRDNLLPRLLFWPVLVGVILLVTLSYFYPGSEQSSREKGTSHANFDPASAFFQGAS